MSDPFKPTPRVIELLGYVEKGWMTGTKFSTELGNAKLHRWYNILVAGYGKGIRNASQRELLHLLTYDLVEETPTPGNRDTYDTTDPKNHKLIGYGMKLTLKRMGKRLLEEARDGRGKGRGSASRSKTNRSKAGQWV